ncbi:MAG: hypothetical protein HC925_09440 [Coleofasciculaceae cyanobacterium SM2_3_26]|nr:hypothetical protein [Coleofasciculaceae cyanobacterium SM2_3_26]
MKFQKLNVRRSSIGILAGVGLLLGLMGAPAATQSGTIESANLTPVAGTAGGRFSLENRDRRGNFCLGYVDNPDAPNHTMVLDRSFDRLTIQVNSRGGNTTLLVLGPTRDPLLRCNDSRDPSPDARIEDTDWAAGEYKIWVGSKDPNVTYEYTISLER